MTDRELLISIGYKFKNDVIWHPFEGHGWSDTPGHIAEIVEDPTFWMEIDEALSSNGYMTEWRHVWITTESRGFEYRAVDLVEYETEKPHATANLAVREVYERIIQQNQSTP